MGVVGRAIGSDGWPYVTECGYRGEAGMVGVRARARGSVGRLCSEKFEYSGEAGITGVLARPKDCARDAGLDCVAYADFGR